MYMETRVKMGPGSSDYGSLTSVSIEFVNDLGNKLFEVVPDSPASRSPRARSLGCCSLVDSRTGQQIVIIE